MVPPTNNAITTRICHNWSISNLRFAFPAQLRPRPQDLIDPPLTIALLELSNISQDEVEEVRRLLRATVNARYRTTKSLDAPCVMFADVHAVRAELLAQQTRQAGATLNLDRSEGTTEAQEQPDLQRKRKQHCVSFNGAQNIRNSKNLASLPQAGADSEASRATNSIEEMVSAPPKKRRIHVDQARTADPRVPEPSIESISVSHATTLPEPKPTELAYSNPSIGLGDIPVPRQKSIQDMILRQTKVEVRIQELLAEQNGHERQAEEYRARATRHRWKAFVLRLSIEELENERTEIATEYSQLQPQYNA